MRIGCDKCARVDISKIPLVEPTCIQPIYPKVPLFVTWPGYIPPNCLTPLACTVYIHNIYIYNIYIYILYNIYIVYYIYILYIVREVYVVYDVHIVYIIYQIVDTINPTSKVYALHSWTVGRGDEREVRIMN